MEDKSGKRNGYKIKSWGDLAAISTVVAVLLTLFISAVLWGLKLEGELNTVRNSYGLRIAALEARVGDGILPRADERIKSVFEDVDKMEKRIERLEDRNNP